MASAVRPDDAVARVGPNELAVLAIECPRDEGEHLTGRVRDALARGGLRATVGWAARDPHHGLADALTKSPHLRATAGRVHPRHGGERLLRTGKAGRGVQPRDEWEQPSFGRELFLGNFRPDLIHPQPELPPEMVDKGEAFLARLRVLPRERRRPARDRARREDPRARHRRAQGARRARDEDPRGVRRPRPQPGLLQPRAGDGRHLARVAVDAAERAPVDRPARSRW